MKVAAVALLTVALLFEPGVFYRVGQQHPPSGKMLVPVHHGRLHDLPGWACRDIADLREQKIELFREVVRAYTKPRDLKHSFFFKFGTGDRRSCRP